MIAIRDVQERVLVDDGVVLWTATGGSGSVPVPYAVNVDGASTSTLDWPISARPSWTCTGLPEGSRAWRK
jgi:hypothetical protein